MGQSCSVSKDFLIVTVHVGQTARRKRVLCNPKTLSYPEAKIHRLKKKKKKKPAAKKPARFFFFTEALTPMGLTQYIQSSIFSFFPHFFLNKTHLKSLIWMHIFQFGAGLLLPTEPSWFYFLFYFFPIRLVCHHNNVSAEAKTKEKHCSRNNVKGWRKASTPCVLYMPRGLL